MSPYRSREYLNLSYADGKTCVRCGAVGCEPCHYSGMFADVLGKGGAQKAFDITADLCRNCHVWFDTYVDGNNEYRAMKFMLLILVTLHRNLQLGLVTLTVNAHPVQRPEQRDRAGRRKQRSRCTASRKTFPRNPTRLA